MTPRQIVENMMDHDRLSQWLGIEILNVKRGYCKATMIVRKDMTNGFGIAHGGISYSFADSVFAFASNSRGRHSVSIESSISHLKMINIGDQILAESEEINITHKTAHYRVQVYRTNPNNELVASFHGVVYRKSLEWA